MTRFSKEQLEFFRQHLFLPPGPIFPQENDQAVDFDEALLNLVTEALGNFSDLVSDEQRSTVQHVTVAISQIIETRNTGDGFVNEEKLLIALKRMSEGDSRKYSAEVDGTKPR